MAFCVSVKSESIESTIFSSSGGKESFVEGVCDLSCEGEGKSSVDLGQIFSFNISSKV